MLDELRTRLDEGHAATERRTNLKGSGRKAGNNSWSVASKQALVRASTGRVGGCNVRRPAPAHRHRALASDPELIICDKAVSSMDVSIQAQLITLLADLRDRLGLVYIFITHDRGIKACLPSSARRPPR
jgi:ABC-type uncharacterized transport system YnjBCD ATPase subunit